MAFSFAWYTWSVVQSDTLDLTWWFVSIPALLGIFGNIQGLVYRAKVYRPCKEATRNLRAWILETRDLAEGKRVEGPEMV